MSGTDNPQSPGRAPTRQWAEANYYTASYTKLRLAGESIAPEVPRGCDRLHKSGWIDAYVRQNVSRIDGCTLNREIQSAIGGRRLAEARVLLEEKRRRWLWVCEQLGFGGAA
jgi:hypothetical protein